MSKYKNIPEVLEAHGITQTPALMTDLEEVIEATAVAVLLPFADALATAAPRDWLARAYTREEDRA